MTMNAYAYSSVPEGADRPAERGLQHLEKALARSREIEAILARFRISGTPCPSTPLRKRRMPWTTCTG